MRIYFARHGESEANVLRVHSNRGFQHPLTAAGRQQAATVAEHLQQVEVTALYSSPLMRAVQTAEIVSEALGVPFEVTDALREYDCGILEGRADEAGWQQHMAMVDDWLQNGNWERRIEGGESLLDIKARFVPFVEGLVKRYRGSAANVVLIGHGGLYRCMLPLVLANADLSFVPYYTQYVLAELGPQGLVGRGVSIPHTPGA